ncbi:hypothetical protein [Streptomyces griseoluteus]
MTGRRPGTPGHMAFDHEEAPVLDALAGLKTVPAVAEHGTGN